MSMRRLTICPTLYSVPPRHQAGIRPEPSLGDGEVDLTYGVGKACIPTPSDLQCVSVAGPVNGFASGYATGPAWVAANMC